MRPDIWDAVKPLLEKIKLIIWLHGAEVQPWWRREYNFTTEDERDKAKISSDERMACFRNIFKTAETTDIYFVFVSKYFADEVFEDYGINLPARKMNIIHNAIDTQIFNYAPKPIEQRRYILSVRPWTNRKYGNDIAIRSVQMLADKQPVIFENMKFMFVGQGLLWNELTAPLKKYANVILKNEFLTHGQIAELHKQYGVFLVPTRMDSQGVSRDEAMSSGLVAITNAVAAIPEFCTDGEDSLLVASEDARGMADAMLKLYNDSDLFTRLSQNAAKRVRRQSDKKLMIKKELFLFK